MDGELPGWPHLKDEGSRVELPNVQVSDTTKA